MLSGNVRRKRKTESGLSMLRLRVDRVLRGDTSGLKRSSVDVHIFSGTDTAWVQRGQNVVLSGIVHEGSVFVVDPSIEDYSSGLEGAILLDC